MLNTGVRPVGLFPQGVGHVWVVTIATVKLVVPLLSSPLETSYMHKTPTRHTQDKAKSKQTKRIETKRKQQTHIARAGPGKQSGTGG